MVQIEWRSTYVLFRLKRVNELNTKLATQEVFACCVWCGRLGGRVGTLYGSDLINRIRDCMDGAISKEHWGLRSGRWCVNRYFQWDRCVRST